MSFPARDKFSLVDIQNLITGYSTKIITPYGNRCSISADNSTGRPFRILEDII